MTRWSTENGLIVFLLEKLTNDVDQISLKGSGFMSYGPLFCIKKNSSVNEKRHFTMHLRISVFKTEVGGPWVLLEPLPFM